MPRKKPYSGKQKKEQMKQRRERRRDHATNYRDKERVDTATESPCLAATGTQRVTQADLNPKVLGREDSLVSSFDRLTPQQIRANKLYTMEPFKRLPPTALEIGVDEMYTHVIDIPQRPTWSNAESKAQLDARETNYFNDWLQQIFAKYDRSQLSFFEKNLEVWRQLWRVLEISDIVLLIADVRHPLLHFPPSLYQYVVHHLKKKLLVVFSKVDMVAPVTVKAWIQFFADQFPEVVVVPYASYQSDRQMVEDTRVQDVKMRLRRSRHHILQNTGAAALLESCRDLARTLPVRAPIDWDGLIQRYNTSATGEERQLDPPTPNLSAVSVDKPPAESGNFLTLGMVGHPNVGKSSLINSLMGRVVVSASKTPGHTKHFQTLLLTPSLRLCDCPGLVFPSETPKPVQILSGLYNVAQVQEPYTAVQYLVERVPLEALLKLTATDEILAPGQKYWTAWTLCEAYAVRRGFFTSRVCRPDVYRAANTLLRMTVEGRILLSFKPPGFFATTQPGANLMGAQYVPLEALELDVQQEAPSLDQTDLKLDPVRSSTDEENTEDEFDSEDGDTDMENVGSEVEHIRKSFTKHRSPTRHSSEAEGDLNDEDDDTVNSGTFGLLSESTV
ncbi:hypothetical protein IWQ61_009948 [Dispira simplex]|nr:hypothetical protein IWQ61_009948 [Dispira simplex]